MEFESKYKTFHSTKLFENDLWKYRPFCSGTNMIRWSYFCHLRLVVPTVNLPHLLKPIINSCVVSLCNSAIINLNIKIFRGQNNLGKGTYSWGFFVVYSFNYLSGVKMLRRAFYVLPPTCYAKSLTHLPPWRRINASVYRLGIGSDNSLSPIWCKVIIWTNAGSLLIGTQGPNFSEIFIEKYKTFHSRNQPEDIVRDMAAILSRGDELKWECLQVFWMPLVQKLFSGNYVVRGNSKSWQCGRKWLLNEAVISKQWKQTKEVSWLKV